MHVFPKIQLTNYLLSLVLLWMIIHKLQANTSHNSMGLVGLVYTGNFWNRETAALYPLYDWYIYQCIQD